MYGDALINIIQSFILLCIVATVNCKINCKYWIDFDSYGMRHFCLGVILPVLNYIIIGLWICADKTYFFRINTLEFGKNTIFLLLFGFAYLGVAIFEETLFRGVILQQLNKKTSVTISIIIQALIFALIHYFSYQNEENFYIKILTAFILAIIFGIITIKAKSLMFAIGAHFAYNLGSKILFSDDLYKFNRLIYLEKNQATIKYKYIILGLDYKILIILVLILIITLIKKDSICGYLNLERND